MAIALDPKRTWDYVLEEERKLHAAEQTVFKLRALTPAELAEVADSGFVHYMGGKEVRATPSKQVLMTLRAGLVGWTRFKKADGSELEAPDSADERIAYLSEEHRIEIAREIRFGGQMTKTEGNS